MATNSCEPVQCCCVHWWRPETEAGKARDQKCLGYSSAKIIAFCAVYDATHRRPGKGKLENQVRVEPPHLAGVPKFATNPRQYQRNPFVPKPTPTGKSWKPAKSRNACLISPRRWDANAPGGYQRRTSAFKTALSARQAGTAWLAHSKT